MAINQQKIIHQVLTKSETIRGFTYFCFEY